MARGNEFRFPSGSIQKALYHTKLLKLLKLTNAIRPTKKRYAAHFMIIALSAST